MTSIFFLQCIIEHLLDLVFVISRIIKVKGAVISNNQGLGMGYQPQPLVNNPHLDLDYHGYHKNLIQFCIYAKCTETLWPCERIACLQRILIILVNSNTVFTYCFSKSFSLSYVCLTSRHKNAVTLIQCYFRIMHIFDLWKYF